LKIPGGVSLSRLDKPVQVPYVNQHAPQIVPGTVTFTRAQRWEADSGELPGENVVAGRPVRHAKVLGNLF